VVRTRYLALLSVLALATLAGPAGATFKGHNGRIAWALWNAGGGGGGGYASLTTYTASGGAHRGLGYCPEDDNGNVCSNWYDVAYSPDGTQLLWGQPDSTGKRVIMLAGADGSSPTPVDHEVADDSQASFSPSGSRIVYIRQPVGRGHLFGTLVTSDLTGGNVKVVSSLRATEPEFTPDGKHLLFARPDELGYHTGLWMIDTTGHGLHRLLPHALAYDVSPDGRHLAYVNEPGDLYVANADGSHRRRLAGRPGGDPIQAVRYSPNGKLIVFAGEGMGDALFTVAATGGSPKLIVNNGDGRTNTTGLSWQPRP
jgi:Tol biopolymer transport system component